MSRLLEIPETVYVALEKAAQGAGMSPTDWIAVHVAKTGVVEPAASNGGEANASLADLLKGRIGRIASGGQSTYSINTGEQFTDYLMSKKRANNL